MTVYIVTGDGPRCGSSMMMQALEAGGMQIVYSLQSESDIQAHGDYHPHPGAHREIALEHQEVLGFPSPEIYDGKALKIYPAPWGYLSNIVAGDYKIIWMHRSAEERWPSFMAAHSVKPLEHAKFYGTPEGDEHQEVRDARALEGMEIMFQRGDVDIIEMNYSDVVAVPLNCFRWLQEHGWPINPVAAATVPDPKYYRFRGVA